MDFLHCWLRKDFVVRNMHKHFLSIHICISVKNMHVLDNINAKSKKKSIFRKKKQKRNTENNKDDDHLVAYFAFIEYSLILRGLISITNTHTQLIKSDFLFFSSFSLSISFFGFCRYENWHGFYKGLGTNLLRVTPATVITFVIYEHISDYLLNQRPKSKMNSWKFNPNITQ